MKPYGYTGTGKSKLWDLGFEDVIAIIIAGRKSSIGKLPEKCGVFKGYRRSSKAKQAARRYFKKALRQQNKNELSKFRNE